MTFLLCNLFKGDVAWVYPQEKQGRCFAQTPRHLFCESIAWQYCNVLQNDNDSSNFLGDFSALSISRPRYKHSYFAKGADRKVNIRDCGSGVLRGL